MNINPDTSSPFPALLAFNVIVFGIAGYHFQTGLSPLLMMLIGMLTGFILTYVCFLLFRLLGKGINYLPEKISAAVLASLMGLILLKSYAFRWPDQLFYPVILLGIFFSIVVYYSLRRIKRDRKSIAAWTGILAALVFLVAGLQWLRDEGADPFIADLPPPFSKTKVPTLEERGLENPAVAGTYMVQQFTYGSGTDEQREAFGRQVKYQTPSVDASKILSDWKGKKKKWRERYWGFGVADFPLNGRVYLPEGEGPFPLILIVHGNHSMTDYSDGGYAYLGELLASRGYITVSVDENFVNGHWSGDFRGKEMPVRAWLLLKHLEQWAAWNNDQTHDLAGRVDLNEIMLVGHSRGGEAVSIAAAFNRLDYFPDDASVSFDFNFNIRGVVAIAPTDYRYHRKIALENINFLSLQGSYDADETSFWGMRAYRRLQFTDDASWFKAGVYLHRANHGQFNSSWGRSDFGGPFKWLLNRGALISGNDQRTAAKVFISAFAAAVLKGDFAYLPIFDNVNFARDWLPENYYLTHFEDENCYTIVDFEDDLDLGTGGPDARIQTENLKVWREENLKTRDGGSQENNVAVVGWDYGAEINPDSLASFEVTISDSLSMPLDSSGSLRMVLAAGSYKELAKQSKAPKKRAEPELDCKIVLTDALGNTTEMLLSNSKAIAPRLKSKFTKLSSLDKDMLGKEWEVQPESYALPFADFQNQGSSFDFKQLKKIRLVFDRSNYGVLMIDDIGVRNR